MSDPDPPTHLGEIYSMGQRRASREEPFPSLPGGGGVPPRHEGGVQQDEVDLDPQDPPYSPPHACDSPETALPWNADAAGAAAVGKFLEKAAEIGFADAPGGVPNLLNREFGNFLIRGPGQTIDSTPVTAGLAGSPTDLSLNLHNTTPYNYQGDVHSHPFGNPLPSDEDWNTFMTNNNLARDVGRIDETFYMYVVAVDQNGGPPTIYVYQDGPRAAGSANPPQPTKAGPEVNPDAQPC